MKGQVLITLAIITVLVLFFISTELVHVETYEFSDPPIESFENIKNELKRSGEILTWKNNYTVLFDFVKFIKERKDAEIFYSIAEFNGSTLNITLVNFLPEAIQDINVSQNLTDETKTITSISSEGSDSVNFTWSGSETTFEVNITYKGSTSGVVTRHRYLAKAGPSRYVTIFYDFKLNFLDSYIRDKFSILGEEVD